MIHRAAGEPEVYDAEGFDDVPYYMYYADAITWAREVGIALGVGDGLFAPESTLTWQQAVTFVYRALDILDIEVEDGTEYDLAEFYDADEIAEFALIPAATLVSIGAVVGEDGMLMPESDFTRAQMARALAVVLQIQRD